MREAVGGPGELMIVLALDRGEVPLLPVRETRCAVCEDASERTVEPGRADAWVLRHSTATGHRDFHEETTAALHVIPVPREAR